MDDDAPDEAARRERALGLLMVGLILLLLAFVSLFTSYPMSTVPLNYSGPDLVTPLVLAIVGGVLVGAGLLVRRNRVPRHS